MRSLINKVDEINVLASQYKPDFFFFSESWLNDRIPDICVNVSGYCIYRCDRINKRGGGVCVFYKNDITINPIELSHGICSEIDILCFKSNSTFFIVVYIPPNLSKTVHTNIIEFLIDKLDELLDKNPYEKLIICGDFNDFSVKPVMQSYNLVNIVKSPTRKKAMLDYFLVEKDFSQNFHCIVTQIITLYTLNQTKRLYKKHAKLLLI